MPPLSPVELEMELIDLLRAQGLPAEEIRLIALLGQGTRATVFSVIIDGRYHVLKVYDTKESLRAELKNLRRMIPKDRLLLWWQERLGRGRLNLAIIEVPEGHQLTAALLRPETPQQLAAGLVSLHRLRYRQRVSVTALGERLERLAPGFLAEVERLRLPLGEYRDLVKHLRLQLAQNPSLFRVNKVRVHGDLWWPNIIAAQEGLYLIDWESVRRGDAAEDLAKWRVSLYFPRDAGRNFFFWNGAADLPTTADLFRRSVDAHMAGTQDETLVERLRLYLPLACMESLSIRHLEAVVTSELDETLSWIVANDSLALHRDPLSFPAAGELADYFGLVKQAAGTVA